MTAAPVADPAAEPVTLAEAKAHCRIDTDTEDAILLALISAARRHVESETRRVLVARPWRIWFDVWSADGRLVLPVAPVLSVDAVTIYDGDGVGSVLDAAAYEVDTRSVPARLALTARAGGVVPGRTMNGVEIDVTAGHGEASDVPAPLRQAVLLLVAHWFEHREAAAGAGGGLALTPLGVAALIAPYRIPRL